MFSSQWLLDDHSGFWIQAFTFGIKIKLHLSTKSNLAFIIKYWTCPFVMHPVGMYTNRMKTQMYIKDLGSQIHQLILFLSRGNSLSLYARPHGVKVPHDQILKHSHAFPNYWEQKKKKKTSLIIPSYTLNQRKMVIYGLLEYKIWKNDCLGNCEFMHMLVLRKVASLFLNGQCSCETLNIVASITKNGVLH